MTVQKLTLAPSAFIPWKALYPEEGYYGYMAAGFEKGNK